MSFSRSFSPSSKTLFKRKIKRRKKRAGEGGGRTCGWENPNDLIAFLNGDGDDITAQ